MTQFMTADWAEECQRVINGWPDDERKTTKLQEFWDWITMIGSFVTGRLALTVRDLPPAGDGDTLVLEFEGGTVTGATIRERSDAEADAVFLLAGDYADWLAMLGGYDVGKMIMYRKLMLEKGDTLRFFTAAFFWTELLAAIQSVPVTAPEPART